MSRKGLLWQRVVSSATFLVVLCSHALYLRHLFESPTEGWADVGVGQGELFGFDFYLQSQDYFVGFSYALGAGFAVWAFVRYLAIRNAAMAAGAAGSVTLIGLLMAAGCFMTGCCGSPMLGIYVGIFGAKALGIGKPLMAFITVLSVAFSYWYLSRRVPHCGK